MVRSRKYRKIVFLAIATLVGIFLVRYFAHSWSAIQPELTTPSLLWIGIALVTGTVFFLARIAGWQSLLRSLGYPQTYKRSGRMLMLSELIRYIPGNIWSVLGRIAQGQAAGIPTDKTFFATVVDILGLCSSSLIASGVFGILATHVPWWLHVVAVIGIAVGGIALLASKYLARPVNWALARFHRPLVQWSLTRSAFSKMVVWQTLGWLGFGFSGYACSRVFLNLPGSTALAIAAVLPLSWLVGYVSFLTPSGIGVRELIITTVLQPIIGSSGIVVAALDRFGITLVELIVAGFFATTFLRERLMVIWKWLRSPAALITLACVAFAVYFGIIAVVMNQKVITAHLDLGNMDQVVWNTLHIFFFIHALN